MCVRSVVFNRPDADFAHVQADDRPVTKLPVVTFSTTDEHLDLRGVRKDIDAFSRRFGNYSRSHFQVRLPTILIQEKVGMVHNLGTDVTTSPLYV